MRGLTGEDAMVNDRWRGAGLVLAACGLVTAAAIALAQAGESGPPEPREDARLCLGGAGPLPPLI